ncbi:carboxypeptidase regulatory-like domain-containing protein [Paludisphaera borealis]|uniref:Nickel uptake substrate-specific transmembrane region n=1 Tax=Paludisphaera borealis TaxID=1387353 RepID=A0A1U7CL35_9BACT|nr:carboxypeptidase regulatory-like domain-containing protein [Paludisphaera borealis]APW59593.1 hypothetical protein BSF38_01020 [Paludisphaera borealis]
MSPALIPLILLALTADRPVLVGRVTTTDGAPVVGAHVAIDSAGVRKGTSPLCPSCYLDCRKSAETDVKGEFRIDAVDPELLFNVLVMADGFRPTFAMKSDPLKEPVKVTLSAFDPSTFEANRILKGVVVDAGGRPLAGVKLTPQGFATEAFRGFSPDILDPLAVTNLKGEFVMTSKSPMEYADLRATGSGVAPRIFHGCKPEANPQTLTMTPGATLIGRVVRDGKPVVGCEVGLVQVNRGSDGWLGETSVGTDSDGRFTFVNVHPDEGYFVYTVMGSVKDGGAADAKKIHSGGEGATTDAGDFVVVRGHTIKGRVLLSDEKPVPPKTRLLLSREDAWDARYFDLDAEGRFAIDGLPTERYMLNVALKGYAVSPKNHSIDTQNGRSLVGMIDQDIDGLKILLEPRAR